MDAMFETGYNRRDRNAEEEPYGSLALQRTGYMSEDKSANKGAHLVPQAKTPDEPANESSSTLSDIAKHLQHVQEPKIISELHDTKNQLSSLIKNASKNKDVLTERNKRIEESKKKSRSRYGW